MGLVHVEFEWSDEHGTCCDCGLPAAYVLDGVSRRPDNAPSAEDFRCSICAALAASEGERIRYLFAEDEAYAHESHGGAAGSFRAEGCTLCPEDVPDYKAINGCESDLEACCTAGGVCDSDLEGCCIAAADASEIVSVAGVNPHCDICDEAQQPEDDWNGDTGNHVACEANDDLGREFAMAHAIADGSW